MAKKNATNILVKSLTKGEKRYFKLQSELQQGSKNYTLLFDYIDTHEVCDSASLNEHFADKPMGRQLHVTKNYLSDMIMKSLRVFHDSSSKQREISNLISNIEILFSKELFDHCESTLKKAQKLAETYEKYHELLTILSWQRRLISSRTGAFKGATFIPKILEYEKDIILRLHNQNDYQLLTNQLLTTNFGDEKAISAIFNNPILSSPEKAKSFSAKVLFYHLHYVLNTLTSRPDKAESTLEFLIKLFENQPHQITENMEGYVTSLNNLMSFYIHRRRQKEALILLLKIRQLPEKYMFKNHNYLLKVFLKTYNAELELYRDMKDWSKGLALINEIRTFMVSNPKIITEGQLISFHYQFAYIFFMSGDLSQSLKSLNYMINENFHKERYDVLTFSRFLLLIVHFELENITVLRYAVDSTRRFLKKNKGKLITFEQRLLSFFSKLSTSPEANYHLLFDKLKKELFSDIDDHQKTRILDYLDFESWINGKLKEH